MREGGADFLEVACFLSLLRPPTLGSQEAPPIFVFYETFIPHNFSRALDCGADVVAIADQQGDSKCLEQSGACVPQCGLVHDQKALRVWGVEDYVAEAEHNCEGVPEANVMA